MKKAAFVLGLGVVAALAGVLLMRSDRGKLAADAAETTATEPTPQFGSVAEIQEYYQRKVFAAMKEYLSRAEEPADAQDGYHWVMQTTVDRGWYDLGGPLALDYLKRHDDDGPLVVVVGAEIVAGVSLAQQGKFEEALEVFEHHLARGNAQLAEVAMSFADMLVVEFSLGRKPAMAKATYQKLLDAYGSLAVVRDRAESRMGRTEMIGKAAPRIGASDLDGEWVNLEDYKGKVVMVDFWATWCGPCLEELPNVKAVYEAYHDKGFEIVGVSLDDSTRVLGQFLEENRLPWRTVFNGEAAEGPIDVRYLTGGTTPATYLIDKQGNIAALDVRGHRLDSAVRQLLGMGG